MRIVMLGWEFPPYIAGGLGVACYGLTKALDRIGHEILFILPRPVDRSLSSHVRMLSPEGMPPAADSSSAVDAGEWYETTPSGPAQIAHSASFEHTTFVGVQASMSSPYPGAKRIRRKPGRAIIGADGRPTGEFEVEEIIEEFTDTVDPEPSAGGPMFGRSGAGRGYRGDLFAEADRYAKLVVALTRGLKFDLIHAHDWLTYPAGQALARATGKPLIVHVHSTDFDRSGDNINQRVYDIERRGMMGSMRVVCVSELTKTICVTRYGIDPSRIDVVYNGIDRESAQPQLGEGIRSKDKIVLFLGRITMQKGPEYFIGAAKRVLEKVPEAKFIVAGSGDMELRMIEMAAELGIGHRVLFTGFLRGDDVHRVFKMADCYVMPSVSEPFGIAPLEAINADVPTIISKTSGVSEVLQHTLKVDFWDIDEMANKIVAVLRHPPLSQTLREHGSFELRRLTWDGAAKVCEQVYSKAVRGQTATVA